MSEVYKKFVAAVAADQGVNPNDVALQCIGVAMRLPASAKYLTAAPPDVSIFPVPDYNALTTEIEALKAEIATLNAREITVNSTDTAITSDTAALTAEIEALKAEVEALKAANEALKATGKAPKAPKAPKAEAEAEKKERNVGRKLISVSGLDGDAPNTDHSWRSLVVELAARAVAAGKKSDLPENYFRDVASKATTTIDSGEHVFASLVAAEGEKRAGVIAKVLGLTLTFKVTEPDGTEVDVIAA